jgi:mRNA-degrading endonuclease RelE of RelBE toxin-antitoxin system
MRIIETPTFFRQASELLDDLESWALEETVALKPDLGRLIPGGRGLRKLRWGLKRQGRGKSGGLRIIYYYQARSGTIPFLLAYRKSKQADLDRAAIERLASLAEEQLG